MNSQPENKTEPKTEERKMIGVQFPLDKMTSTMIKDANLLVISIPLGVGPNSALGFLWRQLNELTAWFETLEIKLLETGNQASSEPAPTL